mmetsp:Transcript_25117/g.83587  ORF Transcript_25117/g.83587 Transcript_25117/m.83587 type:complete len:233 (-) Transcript_25117:97-795(-)
MNAVWAYCCCVATDASAGAAGAPPRLARAMDGFPSHSCGACRAAVPCFDHHCPFTGGCVGGRNFRHFAVFVLHATLGMADACVLSFPPFRDCVLGQIESEQLGIVRTPPPDEAACLATGPASLLFIPAASLFGVLASLAALHGLLLLNGATTFELSRLARRRGVGVLRDLLRLRAGGGDKWALLWQRPSAEAGWGLRMRVLFLPSAPPPRHCALRAAAEAEEEGRPLGKGSV